MANLIKTIYLNCKNEIQNYSVYGTIIIIIFFYISVCFLYYYMASELERTISLTS